MRRSSSITLLKVIVKWRIMGIFQAQLFRWLMTQKQISTIFPVCSFETAWNLRMKIRCIGVEERREIIMEIDLLTPCVVSFAFVNYAPVYWMQRLWIN